MATDARSLAAAWDAATDDDVRAVLAARDVSPTAPWQNFFDAAEHLLQPAAIADALGRVSLTTATALARDATLSDEGLAELRTLGLLDGEGRVLPSVSTVVRQLPAPGQAAPAPDPIDSAAAAERALVTVSGIADLVLLSYATPVARIGSGAVSSVEKRRLVDAGVIALADDAELVLSIAGAAGLLKPVDREWLATPDAGQWLAETNVHRWDALRLSFLRTLPDALFQGDALVSGSLWAGVFPWRSSWQADSARLLRVAVLLGLIDATTARATPWARREHPDVAALRAHLPHEVDRVFLQNDLSVIAPGPLVPALDLRLRAMASRESQAQASTYRFTAESVQNALSRGESEESVLEFLTALSLTGIPQPLRYLVHESAAKHGTIRVAHENEHGRSRVHVATAALRQTLLVDQALRPLGFTSEGDDLVSRVARDAVALALADAHYPVAVLAADGSFEPLLRGRIADDGPTDDESYAELLTRLRSADLADMEAAWLHRELEHAVRSRAVLDVTVSLPDGERTFTLEASGLGGGRLRGRDRAADVERTLPLSSIQRISPSA